MNLAGAPEEPAPRRLLSGKNPRPPRPSSKFPRKIQKWEPWDPHPILPKELGWIQSLQPRSGCAPGADSPPWVGSRVTFTLQMTLYLHVLEMLGAGGVPGPQTRAALHPRGVGCLESDSERLLVVALSPARSRLSPPHPKSAATKMPQRPEPHFHPRTRLVPAARLGAATTPSHLAWPAGAPDTRGAAGTPWPLMPRDDCAPRACEVPETREGLSQRRRAGSSPGRGGEENRRSPVPDGAGCTPNTAQPQPPGTFHAPILAATMRPAEKENKVGQRVGLRGRRLPRDGASRVCTDPPGRHRPLAAAVGHRSRWSPGRHSGPSARRRGPPCPRPATPMCRGPCPTLGPAEAQTIATPMNSGIQGHRVLHTLPGEELRESSPRFCGPRPTSSAGPSWSVGAL